MHDRHWPHAPRPIATETMGSWLGRVASAYRMRLDSFEQLIQVDLRMRFECDAWIVLPKLPKSSIRRLAHLARLPEASLHTINREVLESDVPSTFRYCYRCLLVNEEDVFSPYWPERWLREPPDVCGRHGEMSSIDRVMFSLRGNTTLLLEYLGGIRDRPSYWESWARRQIRLRKQRQIAAQSSVGSDTSGIKEPTSTIKERH